MGTVLVAAAVTYGTYRLANWAWATWNRHDEEDDPLVRREVLVSHAPNNRRRLRSQRMARCRDEVVIAMSDFLPTLRRSIEALTDTSQDTKTLKQLRNSQNTGHRLQEKDLWNAIKIKAMTRLVATVYAHSILFLVLTTQVFLMGGKLFEEQTRASGSTYDFFFDQGIGLLVRAVERAVDAVVGEWDVTHPSSIHTSREMLDKAIQDICCSLEGKAERPSQRRARSMLRFLLPPEHGMDSAVTDDLAQSIMDETLDILESPVFEDAQRDCLETTLTTMREKSWSKIFIETDHPQHASSPWGSKPLATVLSKLKHTSSSFFETPKIPDVLVLHPSTSSVNLYLPTIQRLPTVLELADVSFN
ncbi:Peroxin-3 [Fragilaria crotonensis]|nr:Peroxin-3 [Fragilaria crotonensis]